MEVTVMMRSFGLDIDGIIHVGANVGQERATYRGAGVKAVLHIEPIEAVFHELQENLRGFEGQIAVRALCSSRNNELVRFNVASNGGASSSMLGLGAHGDIHPGIFYARQEEMLTRTLDSIVETDVPDFPFNVLVIDVQGAEIKVLEGAVAVLDRVDGIFVEVSEEPLYEGGCTLAEVTAFLQVRGFRMKGLQIGVYGYGDAFYVHERVFADKSLPEAGPNLALNKPAKQSSISQWSKNENDAQGAVNGVISGRFGFHTDLDDNPWWQVDLQAVHRVKEIRIYNRGDGCAERARNLIVLLSNDETNWRKIHDQNGLIFGSSVPKRPFLQVFPNGQEARFVRLQLNGREYMHLDQVEVY